jgi:succinate dehydrogenase / fumarate reductase cytochrome b subunit
LEESAALRRLFLRVGAAGGAIGGALRRRQASFTTVVRRGRPAAGVFFILKAKNAPMAHPRPLSPHLSIYRPMLTMMMSIVHRITGVGLYFGMLLLAWWFMAVASGPNAYANLQWAMGSWFGRLISLGFTWALLHHALGGVRHLIWDVGYGFEHNEREWMARASLIGSILLTVLLWVAGYLVVGRS